MNREERDDLARVLRRHDEQIASLQSEARRGIDTKGESEHVLFMLASGEMLIIPRSAPNRIVSRQPVIVGGDPLDEASRLAEFSRHIQDALEELGEYQGSDE